MIRILFFQFLVVALVVGAIAEEEIAVREAAVKRIGDARFRIGEVEFDARARTVSLPVSVNMQEGGPMEYVLVNVSGKIHESVLVTSASPMDIQIALKLLSFKAGKGDLFNRLLAPEMIATEGGKESDRGDSLEVSVTFDGEKKEIPASSFILDAETGNPMPSEPWVYSGSVTERGTFLAEAEGSIVAVYLDSGALMNMTREGAENDERWGANKAMIPEIGTKGTLTIRPAKKL